MSWHTIEVSTGVFRLDDAEGRTVGDIKRQGNGMWRVTMNVVDVQCDAADYVRALYFVDGVYKTLRALGTA